MTALLAFALAAALAVKPDAPCPGETTQDMNRCFKRPIGQGGRRAGPICRRRPQASQGGGRRRSAGRRQRRESAAWVRRGRASRGAGYRDAECGAVYDYWSGGTIRGTEQLACQIDLTRRHTHTIWRLWLTYMDSTPPLLPEP